MQGMTEYQWKVLKRAVRERFDQPEHLLSLAAGRNAIDLRPEQLEPYMARVEFVLEPEQYQDLDPEFYVLVRYRGHGLGAAMLDQREGRLRSLYPKRWTEPDAAVAF